MLGAGSIIGVGGLVWLNLSGVWEVLSLDTVDFGALPNQAALPVGAHPYSTAYVQDIVGMSGANGAVGVGGFVRLNASNVWEVVRIDNSSRSAFGEASNVALLLPLTAAGQVIYTSPPALWTNDTGRDAKVVNLFGQSLLVRNTTLAPIDVAIGAYQERSVDNGATWTLLGEYSNTILTVQPLSTADVSPPFLTRAYTPPTVPYIPPNTSHGDRISLRVDSVSAPGVTALEAYLWAHNLFVSV
jgi:hypothetical protein